MASTSQDGPPEGKERQGHEDLEHVDELVHLGQGRHGKGRVGKHGHHHAAKALRPWGNQILVDADETFAAPNVGAPFARLQAARRRGAGRPHLNWATADTEQLLSPAGSIDRMTPLCSLVPSPSLRGATHKSVPRRFALRMCVSALVLGCQRPAHRCLDGGTPGCRVVARVWWEAEMVKGRARGDARRGAFYGRTSVRLRRLEGGRTR